MSVDTSSLFTAAVINGVTLANRFAVAPMTRVSAAEEGCANETMMRYYERYARGGFGLLITEGIYPDQSFSHGYLHQPGISDELQARAWRPVVDAVHRHGSRIFAQLMHVGAISQGNRFRDTAVGPSAVPPKGAQMEIYYGGGAFATPAAISEAQIAEAIDGFVATAARAISVAGFDGIELHGANGYLIDQFLTDYTNRRSDRWGGDMRQRTAFPSAVLKAVRAEVGEEVPVGMRISQSKVNDHGHKWAGREQDAEIVFGALAEAGADFIHVTEHEAWQPAFADGDHSLVALARRYAPRTPIIANGGLEDMSMALSVLEAGADIVALGKGALANPDFPSRIRAGRELAAFDPALLGPLANIKPSELTG